MRNLLLSALIAPTIFTLSCNEAQLAPVHPDAIQPVVITEQVVYDTDDPAIWIHPASPDSSLVIGTDKHTDGALFAFDLDGRIVKKSIPLQRPNNVDIVQGFRMNGSLIDLAVTTERQTNKLRIFRLPELEPIDDGGIEVFVGEKDREPMGVAIYTRASDHGVFVIVGRKKGPREGYLWQYELTTSEDGKVVRGKRVRQFGRYSGKKEIEAIAVDNELGFVYYSDETVGVRKYIADPAENDDAEKALFATTGFTSDHEGIAIYKSDESSGYILVSNQQKNSLMVYPREARNDSPDLHPLLVEIPISAVECDGLTATSQSIGSKFPQGMLVAMSNGKVFHYYDWQDILERIIN